MITALTGHLAALNALNRPPNDPEATTRERCSARTFEQLATIRCAAPRAAEERTGLCRPALPLTARGFPDGDEALPEAQQQRRKRLQLIR
jgi:hypothetical protein